MDSNCGEAELSPENHPACGSKAIYKSRKDAAQAASRLRRRIYDATEIPEPINYYRCTLGHRGFHLGHSPGWRKAVGMPRTEIQRPL